MYYEVKVKRTCIVEENNAYGTIKESYLVDAVNYTDVEASVARYMNSEHSGDDYNIQKISKSKVDDLIIKVLVDGEEKLETYYKVRCAYVENIDGHTKKRKVIALVNAGGVEEASSMALTNYDPEDILHYEVVKVEKTSIVGVINNACDEERES